MEERSMPAPIPLPVRQSIFLRWQQGESVGRIAEVLQLSTRTVRNLVRRFAQHGAEGLGPDYDRCATRKMPEDSAAFRKAVDFRRQHPGWGGGLIRVMLHEEHEVSPSTRTLQRWFQHEHLSPAPPGRHPASEKQRARHRHDIWQMDAVDQLRLGSGQRVSWLREVDECSGAVLRTTIFPPGGVEHRGADHRTRDFADGIYRMGNAPGVARR
jgi:transposase